MTNSGPSSTYDMSQVDIVRLENRRDGHLGICHGFARVNGVDLHYAASGRTDRPLMLFVHGFPEFWYAWVPLLMAFGQDYHAVAVDLRGFNLSSKPTDLNAYRTKEVIEDLRQLICHLGHSKAIVVAHDWGGAVAWNFASSHPKQMKALVIINAAHTALFARQLTHDRHQQAASAYMLMFRSPGAEDLLSRNGFAYLRAMLQSSTPNADWFDAETESRYLQAWSQPGALSGGLNYYRATPMHPPTLREPGAAGLRLSEAEFRVTVPTLVLWGERDPYLLPGLLDGLEQFVPQLQLERDPQSSHWMVHEQPARVIEKLRSFLIDNRL
jgi:pimeloyl-ACP methyl ester carboxylesterase